MALLFLLEDAGAAFENARSVSWPSFSVRDAGMFFSSVSLCPARFDENLSVPLELCFCVPDYGVAEKRSWRRARVFYATIVLEFNDHLFFIAVAAFNAAQFPCAEVHGLDTSDNFFSIFCRHDQYIADAAIEDL